MPIPAERVAARFLRRQADAYDDASRATSRLPGLMSSTQTWISELRDQVTLMAALKAAGEKRRLGRIQGIRVKDMQWDGKRVQATVEGSQGDTYTTRITVSPKRGHHCTCPDWKRRGRSVGPCKHVLALGNVWLKERVIPALDGLENRLVSVLEHATI